MKIAVYADTHGIAKAILNEYKTKTGYSIEKTDVEPIDLVCLLGDHSEYDVELISQHYLGTPIIGVYGNHDIRDLYLGTNVANIHKQLYKHNNVSFTGFQGSHRYKQSQIYGYTQKEVLNEFWDLPKADILLCHDGPYGEYYRFVDDAHCGLKGFNKYIKYNKPKIMLFGHHHDNLHFQVYNTDCYCIYGCGILTINDYKVTDIKHYNIY